MIFWKLTYFELYDAFIGNLNVQSKKQLAVILTTILFTSTKQAFQLHRIFQEEKTTFNDDLSAYLGQQKKFFCCADVKFFGSGNQVNQ